MTRTPQRWHVRALLALALAMIVARAAATVTKGELSSPAGFGFMGKFCFQHLPAGDVVGTVQLDLTVPAFNPAQTGPAAHNDQSDIVLVLYDDQEESWPRLLENWEKWSCAEKVAHAKSARSFRPSDWHRSADGQSISLRTSLSTIRQKLRPRFWFFSLARCNGGFNGVSYRLHTTQAEQGAWSRELGANERGLNTLYLWAFFAAAALLAAHAHSTVQLHAALHYLHPLLRLFLLLLLGQTLALLALLLHYGTYARDGAGSPGLRNFGAVADCASRAALVLLLLLLGKGWTLSSERLTQRGAVTAVALAHLALGLVVALWGTNDDGMAADEARSGPGAVRQLVAFLHASAWAGCGVWFCLLVWSSAKSELKDADKRHLYIWIGAVFAPWFFLPPVASMLSIFVDPWARAFVVQSLTVCSSLLACAALTALFWHTRAQNSFAIAAPDVVAEYEQL